MDDYICWNKHGEEGVNDRDGEEGLHETCAGGEEAPFGNEELCDDGVAEIAASLSLQLRIWRRWCVTPLALMSTLVQSSRS